jgi:hypothetical protein
MVDLSKVDMNAKEPVYADDNDNLYVYNPDSGNLFRLSPRDFAGKVGQPLPGFIKGKGNMRCLGTFRLCY